MSSLGANASVVHDSRMSDSISALTVRIRAFVAAREWQQYHNPKDMAVAIAAEAGELLQHFVWQQPDQVDRRAQEKRDEIASEIADVGILLFEMADLLGMNLGEVMEAKIARNEQRYPQDKARGNNLKYNEL
jgi:NTP pyrophosphatase (non-canonical NTP hydrolase)